MQRLRLSYELDSMTFALIASDCSDNWCIPGHHGRISMLSVMLLQPDWRGDAIKASVERVHVRHIIILTLNSRLSVLLASRHADVSSSCRLSDHCCGARHCLEPLLRGVVVSESELF